MAVLEVNYEHSNAFINRWPMLERQTFWNIGLGWSSISAETMCPMLLKRSFSAMDQYYVTMVTVAAEPWGSDYWKSKVWKEEEYLSFHVTILNSSRPNICVKSTEAMQGQLVNIADIGTNVARIPSFTVGKEDEYILRVRDLYKLSLCNIVRLRMHTLTKKTCQSV